MLRISEFSDEESQIDPDQKIGAFSSEEMLEKKKNSETQDLKDK
jgi:hypothetical protein